MYHKSNNDYNVLDLLKFLLIYLCIVHYIEMTNLSPLCPIVSPVENSAIAGSY